MVVVGLRVLGGGCEEAVVVVGGDVFGCKGYGGGVAAEHFGEEGEGDCVMQCKKGG